LTPVMEPFSELIDYLSFKWHYFCSRVLVKIRLRCYRYWIFWDYI